MEIEEEQQPHQPIMYNDEKIITAVLDNQFVIDELIRTLKGELLDSLTNKFIKKGIPLINDDALAWVVGKLHLYTSKIFALTNFNEAIIKSMAYEFEKEVISELMFPDDWGVDRKNRDYIRSMLADTMTATLYKAHDAVTLRKLLEQHNISEVHNDQQNRGALNKLGSMFKL